MQKFSQHIHLVTINAQKNFEKKIKIKFRTFVQKIFDYFETC